MSALMPVQGLVPVVHLTALTIVQGAEFCATMVAQWNVPPHANTVAIV